MVIEWETNDGRVALLIESKVTARFQTDQGQRYAKRALQMIAEETYSACIAALLAPAGYLTAANTEAAWFNIRVSIEEVIEAAERVVPAGNDAVATLKSLVARYDEGGPLGSKGLYPTIHQSISESCERRCNELRVNNNATDWVFFDHPARVPGLEIRYRIKARLVELAFTSSFKGDVERLLQRLEHPLTFARSGRTHFVRLPELDAIEAGRSEMKVEEAEAIAQALEYLMNWWVTVGVPACFGELPHAI